MKCSKDTNHIKNLQEQERALAEAQTLAARDDPEEGRAEQIRRHLFWLSLNIETSAA
jgi:hypothetical protein